MDGSNVPRVLLVDDHAVVRQGLKALLDIDDGIDIVGEAGTADEAVRRVGYDDPDVVIMDVRLPDGSGVEACREIRSRFPEVKVLMFTSYADEEALFSSIIAGAAGYVLKRIDATELVSAIHKVADGQSLLDPALTEQVFRRIRGEEPDDPLIARLSQQERRVLELIGDGMTNRQIADEMYLAEKTVKNYVSSVLRKLDMKRRSEAAAYAARLAAKRDQKYPPEEWG